MRPIKKILCAVDLQDYSPLVAEYATAMAARFGAEIVALHVATLGSAAGVGYEMDTVYLRKLEDENRENAETAMREFMTHFPGVPAVGKVTAGVPAEQILAQAQEEGADIIVMGTMGRRGIDRLLFGSVAQAVVKSSPVPVLTIRPPYEVQGG